MDEQKVYNWCTVLYRVRLALCWSTTTKQQDSLAWSHLNKWHKSSHTTITPSQTNKRNDNTHTHKRTQGKTSLDFTSERKQNNLKRQQTNNNDSKDPRGPIKSNVTTQGTKKWMDEHSFWVGGAALLSRRSPETHLLASAQQPLNKERAVPIRGSVPTYQLLRNGAHIATGVHVHKSNSPSYFKNVVPPEPPPPPTL